MPDFVPNGSTLAFDFGLARIGVAQGDVLMCMAHPIKTINAEDNQTRFSEIEALIEEWQPEQLVVGLPTHMDKTEHEMTERSRRFARQLRGRFSLPTYLVDERLSSAIAEDLLKEAQVFGKKQKLYLDQVAAQAILYTFFENMHDPLSVNKL